MNIFTITCLRYNPPSTGLDSRTWGWYPTYEEAEKAILSNEGDMFENGRYQDAVIESVPEGISPSIQERWFFRAKYQSTWTDMKPSIRAIKEPKTCNRIQISKITNLSMG